VPTRLDRDPWAQIRKLSATQAEVVVPTAGKAASITDMSKE
jgi:hypothetical protein